MKHPFGFPGRETRQAWVDVARGRRAPDRYLQGGRILNVFTGELLEAGVALLGDRIAYVGSARPLIGEDTIVEDLRGRVLVPAYIEVHSHPFNVYTLETFTRFSLERGTVTFVADTAVCLASLKGAFRRLLDRPAAAPARVLWGLRAAPATQVTLDGDPLEEAFGLNEAELLALLAHPRVIQLFEWTEWVPTVQQGAAPARLVEEALRLGLRVDTHAPGASHRTLAALAAAGATDCHESIASGDVLERLRAGLYAPLRHSSLRPDLPELVRAVRATDGFERLMLTTDGPTPAALADGLLDQAIRVAVEHGVRPADAIRMATLHPASYLGLEADLGSVAPGRLADILVLDDLAEPTPRKVYVGGRPVDELLPDRDEGKVSGGANSAGILEEFGIGPFRLEHRLDANALAPRPEHFGVAPAHDSADGSVEVPVVEMQNAVITRVGKAILPVRDGVIDFSADPSLLLAVVLDQGRGRMVHALLRGFGSVEALISTYTVAQKPLILGRNLDTMARALDRVGEAGGGISLWDEEERFFLSLPLGGGLTPLPIPELAARCTELAERLDERGHPFHDPIYSLMFLTANHLPGPRLTPVGLWDVMRRALIYPATELT